MQKKGCSSETKALQLTVSEVWYNSGWLSHHDEEKNATNHNIWEHKMQAHGNALLELICQLLWFRNTLCHPFNYIHFSECYSSLQWLSNLPCCYLSPLLCVLFPQALRTICLQQPRYPCSVLILEHEIHPRIFQVFSCGWAFLNQYCCSSYLFHSDSLLPCSAHCWIKSSAGEYHLAGCTQHAAIYPHKRLGCSSRHCAISTESRPQICSFAIYVQSCIYAVHCFYKSPPLSSWSYWTCSPLI